MIRVLVCRPIRPSGCTLTLASAVRLARDRPRVLKSRAMIRKEHGKYVLRDRAGGHVLGRHRTKTAAQRQETAVNLSKARAAGHRVPAPRPRRGQR